MTNPTVKELVAAVKAHAVDHYDADGWDYIVEAYSYDDVAELIEGASTVAEAIKQAAEIMGILDDRRQGAINAGL
tara:strand:- start:286 stop:510 length:225 start_codon:yes stop_codon:yes gene_type:complete